jgi:hypothetical protein
MHIGEIDKLIASETVILRKMIKTFLNNPELPAWTPPHHVTDKSSREFLTNPQIPAYRNGNPSLLLHDLHIYDDEEIEAKFSNCNSMYLIPALSLESLTQWLLGLFATHLGQEKPGA